jgi:hypothetical protein
MIQRRQVVTDVMQQGAEDVFVIAAVLPGGGSLQRMRARYRVSERHWPLPSAATGTGRFSWFVRGLAAARSSPVAP